MLILIIPQAQDTLAAHTHSAVHHCCEITLASQFCQYIAVFQAAVVVATQSPARVNGMVFVFQLATLLALLSN